MMNLVYTNICPKVLYTYMAHQHEPDTHWFPTKFTEMSALLYGFSYTYSKVQTYMLTNILFRNSLVYRGAHNKA